MTSIRLHAGFVSVVAAMDWFSRYVLSWLGSPVLSTGDQELAGCH